MHGLAHRESLWLCLRNSQYTMGTSAQHLPQTERLLQVISTKRNVINIYTDTTHTAADALEYYDILEQFDNVRRALLFPSPSCLRQCRCYCRE